jgi:hypothetical protein
VLARIDAAVSSDDPSSSGDGSNSNSDASSGESEEADAPEDSDELGEESEDPAAEDSDELGDDADPHLSDSSTDNRSKSGDEDADASSVNSECERQSELVAEQRAAQSHGPLHGNEDVVRVAAAFKRKVSTHSQRPTLKELEDDKEFKQRFPGCTQRKQPPALPVDSSCTKRKQPPALPVDSSCSCTSSCYCVSSSEVSSSSGSSSSGSSESDLTQDSSEDDTEYMKRMVHRLRVVSYDLRGLRRALGPVLEASIALSASTRAVQSDIADKETKRARILRKLPAPPTSAGAGAAGAGAASRTGAAGRRRALAIDQRRTAQPGLVSAVEADADADDEADGDEAEAEDENEDEHVSKKRKL